MSKRHRLPNSGKNVEGADDPVEETTETSSAAVELIESTAEQSESGTADEREAVESAGDTTEAEPTEGPSSGVAAAAKRRVDWARVLAFGVIPAVALLLAMVAGYLKWQDNSVRNANAAADEAVQVAKDSTVAMLSYQPETVEQQLNEARNLLTGEFAESYTGLINDVVIPGAKEKQISAVASVPAAAPVSADLDDAVVLVFLNQTVVVGQDAPTDSASSVRVTLEKVDGRWLISQFEPV